MGRWIKREKSRFTYLFLCRKNELDGVMVFKGLKLTKTCSKSSSESMGDEKGRKESGMLKV